MFFKKIRRYYKNQFNSNLNKKILDIKNFNSLKTIYFDNYKNFNCINYSTFFKIIKKKNNYNLDNDFNTNILLKFKEIWTKNIEFIDNNRSLSNIYFYINTIGFKNSLVTVQNINKLLENLILNNKEEFGEDEIFMILNISYDLNKAIFEEKKWYFIKNCKNFSLKSLIIISFNLTKLKEINKEEANIIADIIIERIPKIRFLINQDIGNILYIIGVNEVDKNKKIHILDYFMSKIEKQIIKDPNGIFTSSILYLISKFKYDEILDKDFFQRIEKKVLINFLDNFSIRTILIIIRSYVIMNKGSNELFNKIDNIILDKFDKITFLDIEILLNYNFKANLSNIKIKEIVFRKLEKYYFDLLTNKTSLTIFNIEKMLIGFFNIKNNFVIDKIFLKLLYFFVNDYFKNLKNLNNFKSLSLIMITYIKFTNIEEYTDYKLLVFKKISEELFKINPQITFNILINFVESYILLKKYLIIEERKVISINIQNLIISYFNHNELYQEELDSYSLFLDYFNNFLLILKFLNEINIMWDDFNSKFIKSFDDKTIEFLLINLNPLKKDIWKTYLKKINYNKLIN